MTKLKKIKEKRRALDKNYALELLKEHYEQIFKAYYNAIEKFNVEISQTSIEARTRLWSVLLNAKLIDSFIEQFPENWTKGKYGRIIFRWEEIQLLIKKLDSNNNPSYLPTLLSDSILSQEQASLFKNDERAKNEPILIFGYTKDKYGQLINPRIVYYDCGAKWTIEQSEIITKPVGEQPIVNINVVLKQKEEREAK